MGVLAGDLRTKRASIDTGTGEKRVSDTGRAKHTSRGTFVNWQDDLGISTTEGAAKGIREEKQKFQADIAGRYKIINDNDAILNQGFSKLDTAKGELDAYQARLNAAQGEIDTGYKQSVTDLERLKAWYGWNPNETGAQAQAKAVEYAKRGAPLANMGIYSSDSMTDEQREAEIARASAERAEMARQAAANPERYGDETGSWDPYRGETKFKKLGTGDKVKVRAMLPQAQAKLAENKRRLDEAAANLNTQRGGLQGQYSLVQGQRDSLQEQRGILQGHRDTVKGYEDIDKAQWDKIHGDYKSRQETMKKILGGINFG